MSRNRYYVTGMNGLGDNIYQRSFIEKLNGDVYLETPWPELYQDLKNVFFVEPRTELRTQSKNILKSDVKWVMRPRTYTKHVRVSYSNKPIIEGMADCFGFEPAKMSLPDFGESLHKERYVVVRPVTIRSEWIAETRNPLAQYIYASSLMARSLGYTVISVADLKEGEEWAVDPMPYSDIQYHKGELTTKQLLSLIQHSSGVIGGIGWIAPACMAYEKPALIVCGGQGAYNSPKNIINKKVDIHTSNIVFAVPDDMCMCSLKVHDCNKVISDYDKINTNWFTRLSALV